MNNTFHPQRFLKQDKFSLIVLFVCLAVLVIAAKMPVPPSQETVQGQDYAEYEAAEVTQVLTDTSETNEKDDFAYRGEQTLIMKISSSQYLSKEMMVYNFFGLLYGVPLSVSDSASVIINTLHRAGNGL